MGKMSTTFQGVMGFGLGEVSGQYDLCVQQYKSTCGPIDCFRITASSGWVRGAGAMSCFKHMLAQQVHMLGYALFTCVFPFLTIQSYPKMLLIGDLQSIRSAFDSVGTIPHSVGRVHVPVCLSCVSPDAAYYQEIQGRMHRLRRIAWKSRTYV